MFGTMTMIGLGLLAGGSAANAVGQWKAGGAAARAGEAQQRAQEASAQVHESEAAQYDYNAGVADLQAEDALARGREEESEFRTQVRGMIGSQRAEFAGQGVDVGIGSAADVQGDTARAGELDALKRRSNAQREAWGFRVQGEDLRAGATTARKAATAVRQGGEALAAAGRAQRTTARIGAVGSVVGTGSSLLLSRYGWERRAA